MDTPQLRKTEPQSTDGKEVIEIEAVTISTEDSTSDSPAFLKQMKLTARQKLMKGKQSVDALALNVQKVSEAAHTTSESLVVVGKDKWEIIRDRTQEQSQQRLQWANQLVSAGMTCLGQSTVSVAEAFKDVPTDFFEIINDMPKVPRRMSRACLREGDILRSDADAMALFNKFP